MIHDGRVLSSLVGVLIGGGNGVGTRSSVRFLCNCGPLAISPAVDLGNKVGIKICS
jgi:hypothetical protein